MPYIYELLIDLSILHCGMPVIPSELLKLTASQLLNCKLLIGEKVKLIRCNYGEFTRDRKIGPACWPFFDLLFIHQGQIEIEIEGKASFELSRGQALLIYPETSFQGEAKSDKAIASIHHFSINDNNANSNFAFLKKLADLRQGAKKYSVEGCNQLIADIERSLAYNKKLNQECYFQQLQQSLLGLILCQLTNIKESRLNHSPHKKALNQLVENIENKLDTVIDIAKFSAQLNLSESHFRAEFFKLYQEPPHKYFLRMKMKAACHYLAQTDLVIKHISCLLGYDDITYFYRHFKKVVNTSPALYRKHYQIIG